MEFRFEMAELFKRAAKLTVPPPPPLYAACLIAFQKTNFFNTMISIIGPLLNII